MSDMHFREPNQVKWMGTRPGHNGTQVLEHRESNVAGEALLYTVPVGHTLFLCYYFVGGETQVDRQLGYYIYDDGGLVWKILAYCTTNSTDGVSHLSEHFWPPIEVPAEYEIRVFASVAAFYSACIHGWYE